MHIAVLRDRHMVVVMAKADSMTSWADCVLSTNELKPHSQRCQAVKLVENWHDLSVVIVIADYSAN